MKPFNQINVIPFIDIMLVLLAIVLLTATFISRHQLDLELPAAENSKTPDKNPKNMMITIDAKQQFHIDEMMVDKTRLEAKLNTIPASTPIVLSVDKTVPFEKFILIIDLLKAKHLNNLSIMVKEP